MTALSNQAERTGRMIDIDALLDALEPASPISVSGRVTEVVGLVIKAAVPGVRMGEVCLIHNHHQRQPLRAEVVGFKDEQALLMPLGEPKGVGLDSVVEPTGKPFSILCGDALLGRVIDGLGQAMDGGPPIDQLPGMEEWAVDRPAPDPMKRKRVERPLPMGIRALDACLTFGEGQRVGLFAGSGVGKSTLMGSIARNALSDINVICLVGERGREVLDFIHDSLGEDGMRRSVLVCATSDRPSLERLKCCYVATAVAEYFRDVKGRKVLLMMDSTTRFARAQREIGLAVGEPPARQGYPPSVFSELPRLLERTGNSDKGSITALYTVLVAGGDMEEPIADEVRGILDGHVILDRALGARNHWPAISVPPSLSRVMNSIVSPEHKRLNAKIREVLATYEAQRDLIMLGAYQKGSDPKTDWAIDKIQAVEAFLRQGTHEKADFETTIRQGLAIFADDPD